MDLSTLQGEQSGFLHLEHPATREPLYEDGKPVGFHTASRFSKEWRQKISELANINMNKKKKSSAERQFHDANELFASLIKSVDNLEAPNGEGVSEKVTPKNISQLVFANVRLSWIRDQFEDYLNEDASFFTS